MQKQFSSLSLNDDKSTSHGRTVDTEVSNTLSASDSLCLLIDVQTRLWPVMAESIRQSVLKNLISLLKASQLLNLTLWVSEQYPQGLGSTLEEIKQYLPASQPVLVKTNFSAWYESALQADVAIQKSQVLIFGLETHICVLQTALDALAVGKKVFVVEDAVISREIRHRDNALARMRAEGCIITNTESALFELLGSAHHPQFKAISALIK